MSFCTVPATAAVAVASIEPGESLTQALEKYREAGIRLIWSNGLINDRDQVLNPPDPHQPLEDQLNALLEPHNLRIRHTADGSEVWYVVQRDPPVPASDPDPPQPEMATEAIIEEVLVVSSRRRLVRGSTAIQNLDVSEIQGIPSIGRDLLRIVNTLPGQSDNGVSVRQRIRGGNEDEVLYLIDGARIIEPFHLKDFLGPFSAFNTNTIESVDVYRSGFPVSYGNRSSAVMDFTVAETDSPFSGVVDVNLLMSAAHIQGAAGNWQWLASARRGNLDLILELFDRDYGDPSFDDEMIRLTHQTENSETSFGLFNLSDNATANSPGNGESGQANYQNSVAWITWQRDIGADSMLNLHADLSKVQSDRDGTLDDPIDAVGNLTEERDFDVYRLTGSWTQSFSPQFTLVGGFEYEHQRGDFSAEIFTIYGSLGQPIQPTPVLDRSIDVHRDGEMAAAYLSGRYEFTDSLRAELGVRYDIQDIDPVHDNRLSPRLQIEYDFRKNITLFADVGRYVQHQNLYELQIDDGLLELQSPQVSDQISAGIRLTSGSNLQLQVEVYHKSIDGPQTRFDNFYNRYVLLPELHSDRKQITPAKAQSTGVELSLSGEFGRDLYWRAAYVQSDVEEKFASDWRPRPWDQHKAASAGIDWQPGNWRVGVHTSYHTGWATTPLITESGQSISFYNSDRLKDYATFDVSIARIWQMQSSELELYLDISNLFDRANVGGYTYDLEDGDWEADPQDLLPLTPVLGVRWTW